MTILLVGGLRGDDKFSPALLLNAYKSLSAARIIYFPLANPSGYLMSTKTTYPNHIDIE